MKDFFKNVLATVLGMFLFSAICFGFMMMSIIGMIAASDTETKLKDNSVLTINLSGVINEKASTDYLGFLSGDAVENSGLNDILMAIKKAKNNKAYGYSYNCMPYLLFQSNFNCNIY